MEYASPVALFGGFPKTIIPDKNERFSISFCLPYQAWCDVTMWKEGGVFWVSRYRLLFVMMRGLTLSTDFQQHTINYLIPNTATIAHLCMYSDTVATLTNLAVSQIQATWHGRLLLFVKIEGCSLNVCDWLTHKSVFILISARILR